MNEQDEAILSSPQVVALQAEASRLNKMVRALMNRAERAMSVQSSEFGLFQATITLEAQVRERTRELEDALKENIKITRALQNAQALMRLEIEERKKINEALEQEKREQQVLIHKLEEAQNQLLQSEKLASIGQLAAGVAHEINNPIGFVSSNLSTLRGYVIKLMELIDVYENASCCVASMEGQQKACIDEVRQNIDLDFLREDINILIDESIEGTARVRRIVQDLRDFSRVGSVDRTLVDIHDGLNSTLNILGNEIKHKAVVTREFGDLPLVECIPSQINQVFMNILINAAQAISEQGEIVIRSGCIADGVYIAISDNGKGIAPENISKIFEPFFTTKPVGEGTGLGLSISYGIIKNHGGKLEVQSRLGKGTTFTIHLPIRHQAESDPQYSGVPSGQQHEQQE
ncbi:MAG: two-component system, NtrC family, sensor kinase [Proteobacteria bacterium]|nr:two-component system, NtrC family, sensor kinase [Pseudomonadota bacterium]